MNIIKKALLFLVFIPLFSFEQVINLDSQKQKVLIFNNVAITIDTTTTIACDEIIPCDRVLKSDQIFSLLDASLYIRIDKYFKHEENLLTWKNFI